MSLTGLSSAEKIENFLMGRAGPGHQKLKCDELGRAAAHPLKFDGPGRAAARLMKS